MRYFSKFYGQWDGETHIEQISVESLSAMIEEEFKAGVTELSCHPGFMDVDFASAYDVEREAELRTLCDPRVRARAVQKLLAELAALTTGESAAA